MAPAFLGLPSPRLPAPPSAFWSAPLATAALLHGLVVTLILLLIPPAARRLTNDQPIPPTPAMGIVLPPHLLFQAGASAHGGGGGGGNRQAGPIRHAEGIGPDALTLRTTPRQPQARESVTTDDRLPSIVLDARALASGTFDQLGLPVGGVGYGTSTGPGSGGGVGTGTGTGLGSGEGPGVGPGSDGGTGGGAYRPGGAVSPPRVIVQVQPHYTGDALERRIQGSVLLEVVVTREGRAGQVRVVQSLDPRGLDEEAIATIRQWQFAPGRLSGRPVDVIVTVVMDFSIR